MVNEADLVTRYNNFKHIHRDDTWRDMTHAIMLQLLQLQMKVEEMEKCESKAIEVEPVAPEVKEVLKTIQAIPNETKRSWFKKSAKKK